MARKYFYLSLLLVVSSCQAAFAATSPQRLSFQGKLLDTSNNPRNGTFNFTFRIFDAPSAGNQLWVENQSAVTVSNGVFSVELGSVAALSPALFAGASAYLEIQVSPDSAMTPRQQLLMSAYALRALIADSLTAGDTNYVQVRTTLQSGAVFHVASATVAGPFMATATSSFTASGAETFSLFTSSGLKISAGTLRLENGSSVDAVGTVAAGTVTARTSLLLPSGSALVTEGSARWDSTGDTLSVGTGAGAKTMADTDSAQTLTNKTLDSTGGNTVDATHIRTRSVDSAAPTTGMTLEWDGGASKWAPVYGATATVIPAWLGPNVTIAAGNVLIDTIYLTPVLIPATINVNQIRFRVGAGVAGSTGDVGIYNTNNTLVASGGANTADFTTAGAKIVSVAGAPKTLQPGQYYFALSAKTASPRPRGQDLGTASDGVVKGLSVCTGGGVDSGATLPGNLSGCALADGHIIFFMSINE